MVGALLGLTQVQLEQVQGQSGQALVLVGLAQAGLLQAIQCETARNAATHTEHIVGIEGVCVNDSHLGLVQGWVQQAAGGCLQKTCIPYNDYISPCPGIRTVEITDLPDGDGEGLVGGGGLAKEGGLDDGGGGLFRGVGGGLPAK